ncbi:hypothetical protein NW768_010942 [Fusarium equiseti]|uniref:Bul1 C-terminal domain-containing protein n=1 Tax=Fusarium equiseti TaxID=61235 RepID=A0ABQ8QZ41_FUSEQ|nr:hypothetical protein NW768_010942 [Fusarium equiseti]
MSAAQVLFNSTPNISIAAEPKRRGSWVPTLRKSECPLDVSIDRHFEAKIYTSGSTITGSVSLSPQANLTVDAFDIVFSGSSSTIVQMLHQGSMPKSAHKFLLLRMPIPQSALPEDGVLQAGLTYQVPFSFVIPYQLPSAACKHRNAIIRERHLQLPPTVGPAWEHDDMAVHTVNITYGVEARGSFMTGKGKSLTLERTHPVKVMPFLPEQPPLHIVPGNPRYVLSQEKTIRKDILSSKLGFIRASTLQPDPVTITTDKLQPSDISLNIDLEFWPNGNKEPPEIYAKSASIKASTYYSTGHLSFLPDQHSFPSVMPNPILSFVLDENATVTCPKPNWQLNSSSTPSPPVSRRGSEYSEVGDEPPRNAPRRGSKTSDIIRTEVPRHTASLPISITLPSPDNKILLPTFHSCLISRTYILEIIFASRAHGSSFTLRLPIQIAVEGEGETGVNHVPTYEQVQANQDLFDTLPTYNMTH